MVRGEVDGQNVKRTNKNGTVTAPCETPAQIGQISESSVPIFTVKHIFSR